MILLAGALLATAPSLPARAGEKSAIRAAVLEDLSERRSRDFGALLKRWRKRYGTKAVPVLVKIASDTARADADRYVALMGASQIGGRAIAPVLTRFLKDRSWMIRSGSIRALSALGDPKTASKILPMLKDKALVVRHEAVLAVEKLKPAGSVSALVEAVKDDSNYHKGRAQWVPQRALKALVTVGASSDTAKTLLPLLEKTKDTDLVTEAARAIAKMAGIPLPGTGSAAERARKVKQAVETLLRNDASSTKAASSRKIKSG